MQPATVPATRELCRLSVDYAWLHTIVNLVLVLAWLLAGRRKALLSGHCFGAFAMLMDYVLMYLYKSTRTLDYAPLGDTGPFPYVEPHAYPVNITGVPTPPMPPMTPVGTFAFFWWFDYLGALGVVLFAFTMFEDLLTPGHRRTGLDWATMLLMPCLFWSAPVASPYLGIDGRVLVVTRPSPKGTYLKLLAAFIVPLLAFSKPVKAVGRVYLAGVACGLTHHAALFFWGMRGYSDPMTLIATVCTEWPALIVGVFACTVFVQWFIRTAPLPSLRVACLLGAIAAAAAATQLAGIDPEPFVADLLPYIPGEWMHNIGTFHFRTQTCNRPKGSCLPPADDSMLVMAATAKGGAMLAAKLIFEVSSHCGLCLSGGSREGPGIPGEEEAVPTFEGDAMLAVINMRGWPEHVKSYGRKHKCVVFARDPEERLRSLYLYSRSGGEYWVRTSGLMRRLDQENTTASLEDFWQISGRGYLKQSHEYIQMNQEQGCKVVPYKSFKRDFNGTVKLMLDAWGINSQDAPAILDRTQQYDFGRKSKEELAKDPHHSSSKFSPSLVSEVKAWIQGKDEVQQILARHRKEVQF